MTAEQNQGEGVLKRSCRPELKECITAVYQLPDGSQTLATVPRMQTAISHGARSARTTLPIPVRDCVDWDTGAQYRDVKNTQGEWVQSIVE